VVVGSRAGYTATAYCPFCGKGVGSGESDAVQDSAVSQTRPKLYDHFGHCRSGMTIALHWERDRLARRRRADAAAKTAISAKRLGSRHVIHASNNLWEFRTSLATRASFGRFSTRLEIRMALWQRTAVLAVQDGADILA
jgi:hypothetical protein